MPTLDPHGRAGWWRCGRRPPSRCKLRTGRAPQWTTPSTPPRAWAAPAGRRRTTRTCCPACTRPAPSGCKAGRAPRVDGGTTSGERPGWSSRLGRFGRAADCVAEPVERGSARPALTQWARRGRQQPAAPGTPRPQTACAGSSSCWGCASRRISTRRRQTRSGSACPTGSRRLLLRRRRRRTSAAGPRCRQGARVEMGREAASSGPQQLARSGRQRGYRHKHTTQAHKHTSTQ